MGINPSASAPPTNDVEMAEDAVATSEGLPPAVLAQIDETQASLSAARKKRKPPAGYATAVDIKAYSLKHTIPSLHSASPAGINSLTISSINPTQFLTGGNDKIVQLYDRATDKVLASLKGHTKKINQVALREREGENTLILSGGADKIAKIWGHDSASGEYVPKATIKTHKGEISGLAIHPTSTLAAFASGDHTYSLHDLNTFEQIFRSTPSEESFTALSIHPDGTLIALGTPNSTIQIYDIRSGSIAASLTPENTTPFTINTLSFSENGYHLLAPNSLSTVAVWDLRRQSVTKSFTLSSEGTTKINRVLYDPSAQFLGVAGNFGVKLFAHKTWEEIASFEGMGEGNWAGEVNDIAYGLDGKEVWGVTGRELRVWA